VASVEAELIVKAQAGDPSAYEDLVRRYQRRVYAVAFRILRRHDAADDICQEAFLRGHAALDRFDVARPFGPWIARIAANLAINERRSPRSREEELPEEYVLRSPEPGPLRALLEREAGEMLERALAQLPLEQRAIFVLRTFEDLSYQEIAEALDLPPGTVMSRLSRAREKLRALLLPYLGTPDDPGARR
jgi:RNA polymerase sigma-70 factor, ECF subfamily